MALALLRNKHPSARFPSISRGARLAHRQYATELPRPPPPTTEPEIHTFAEPARPRAFYGRGSHPKELPLIEKRWPALLAFGIIGLAGWGVFLAVVTNKEKLSSSVLQRIMRSVRDSPQLRESLGDAIRLQTEWWLNGDPKIDGTINQVQGNIDLCFRLKGSKNSGTLYFTSVRKDKGLPFTILRFKVILDDGTTVKLQ